MTFSTVIWQETRRTTCWKTEKDHLSNWNIIHFGLVRYCNARGKNRDQLRHRNFSGLLKKALKDRTLLESAYGVLCYSLYLKHQPYMKRFPLGCSFWVSFWSLKSGAASPAPRANIRYHINSISYSWRTWLNSAHNIAGSRKRAITPKDLR